MAKTFANPSTTPVHNWKSSTSLLHVLFFWCSIGCPVVESWSRPFAFGSTGIAPCQVLSMTFTLKTDCIGTDDCIVSNARICAGLPMVLRCASTDGLANVKADGSEAHTCTCMFDEAIRKKAGLILDLRSPSERDEAQAQAWMALTIEDLPPFSVKELRTDQLYHETELRQFIQAYNRHVVRLDIISPNRFMKYIDQHWLSAAKKVQANLFKIVDGYKLHNLRIETLNRQGLLGLNEAILETGKQGLCTALQIITLFLEQSQKRQQGVTPSTQSFDLIVIHCVQGKDRTGLLVMLCQALIGVSQHDIIEDYHKSHDKKENHKEASAALQRITSDQSGPVKLNRTIFNSAPRHVMESTLEYLRSKYGSIAPGYLDHIGFDGAWQQRFQSVASVSTTVITDSVGQSKL